MGAAAACSLHTAQRCKPAKEGRAERCSLDGGAAAAPAWCKPGAQNPGNIIFPALRIRCMRAAGQLDYWQVTRRVKRYLVREIMSDLIPALRTFAQAGFYDDPGMQPVCADAHGKSYNSA